MKGRKVHENPQVFPHLPHLSFTTSVPVSDVGGILRKPQTCQNCKNGSYKRLLPQASLSEKRGLAVNRADIFILQSSKVSKSCLEMFLGPEPRTYIHSKRRLLEDRIYVWNRILLQTPCLPRALGRYEISGAHTGFSGSTVQSKWIHIFRQHFNLSPGFAWCEMEFVFHTKASFKEHWYV